MAQELRSVRAINKAVDAATLGNNGHPVYCTADGHDGNVRVIQARARRGTLQIKSVYGEWITPQLVFSA